MRRPSVFVLVLVALALLGVAAAVVAAATGAVALVLIGVGLVLLAGGLYLADRRSQKRRLSLELRLDKAFAAVRQDLLSGKDLAEVAERLDRLDVRLDEAQRRLSTSIDAARLEAADRTAVTSE